MFDNTEIAFCYKTNNDLKRGRFLFKMISNPVMVNIGKRLTYFALTLHLPVDWAIKPTLYKHFVGGVSLHECEKTIQLLKKYNVKSILDYSVEGGKDRSVMERTLAETLRSIENAAGNPDIPFAVFKPTAFASIEVLTKAALNDESVKGDFEYFRYCVETLCNKAAELEVPIMIDAEDSWYQTLVDDLIEELMQKHNKQKAIVFNTLQMYRTDRLYFLKTSIDKARSGNYFFGVKFVRGAYMEKERKRAAEMGYPSPIQPDKQATDNAYNAALKYSVENIDIVKIFNGSHNEYSNQLLTELMEKHGILKDDDRIWFSQLYGMSDHISFNLAHLGYNVTKYIPYGPVSNILPYLIRRAEENTSIAGQTGRELSLILNELNRRKTL